jgi:uncharacterized membrane protein
MLLHRPFVAIGSGLLIAAFVTDLMYSSRGVIQWANFSAWLITGGLLMALLAVILLIVDALLGHAGRISWPDFVLVGLAALLSLLNVFVHSRDGWTSVVPQGIWLSAIVAILLLVAGFRGWRVTIVHPRLVEGERA